MSDILNSLLNSDAFGLFDADVGEQWGIFRNGEPVVVAEQVRSFSFKQSSPISNYQVEDGGFQSYDKVDLPFEPRVQFASGGDIETREELISSIRAIAGDLNLYDVVTPEAVFIGCNVTDFDIEERTNDRGACLVRVTVRLEEIRVNATSQYGSAAPLTNPRSPTAADKVNVGTVQPQTPNERVRSGFATIESSGWSGH